MIGKELKEGIKTALNKGANIVETQAKLLCPVDTGNLRRSITHNVFDDGFEVGTNVEYAIFVEKGTSKTKAQPYLEPALDMSINDILKIMEEETGRKLKKVRYKKVKL